MPASRATLNMGVAQAIAVFTIAVSLFTFVAFFGRLPAFRNTPVAWLHRLIVLHIPAALRSIDLKLTNGRITNGGASLGHYLMHDKHPVVLVFFLGIVTISACLFLPSIWHLVPIRHKVLALFLLPQPYLFTYLSAKRNKETFVTEDNWAKQMRHYPYDRILYYPGQPCRTCKFLKPARSKHCSICKSCVSRMDHHCVWVNNCLGRGNYRWFLALLLSTSILLAYGAYLAYISMSPLVDEFYTKYEQWYKYKPDPAADPNAWGTYLDMKLHYFLTYASIYLDTGGISASGVGLLALLTWPLPLGLLIYQIYLVYAGMTTNESAKWADWGDDMADGVVFLGKRREDTLQDYHAKEHKHHHQASSSGSPGLTPDADEEPPTTWPLESRHILLRTTNGQPPTNLPARIQSVAEDKSTFQRVWDLSAVENAYDLGFWDNLMDILWH